VTAAVYPKFLDALWSSYDPSAATPTIVALSSAYVYDAAHQYRSDLTGELGTPTALAAVAEASGQITATSPVITGTSPGDIVQSLAVFDDTGVSATSRLWCFIDHKADGTSIFFTSDGTNFTVSLPSSKLFSY